MLSSSLVRTFLCSFMLAQVNAAFEFVRVGTTAPFWDRVDSSIYTTVAPLAFTNSDIDVGVAPIGSWIIYGTQPDVWLTSDKGRTWTVLAGLNGHGLPDGGNVTFENNGSGNQGCGHKSKFNRFYWMGETDQIANPNSAFYQNYYSTDGSEWTEIMEESSNQAMTGRVATRWGFCAVAGDEKVYSIGGQDTWQSVDLGVSWSRVVSTNYFQSRELFMGDLYTPANDPTKEYMIVMAGRGWSTASPYGEEFNDVWLSTNYARTWTRQTAAAPWRTRESPQVVITKQGMIALNGGALCSGYGCETTGPWANSGWLSDVWVSFDNGVGWQRVAERTASLFAQAATVLDEDGFWYTWAGQTGPANNTDYAWTNYGYKSSHSLYQIANWGPPMGIVVPAGFGTIMEGPSLCPAKPIVILPPGQFASTGGNTGGNPGDTTSTGGHTDSTSSSSSKLSDGAIAGIVIGSVVGALLICCLLLFICKGGFASTGSSKSSKFTNEEDPESQVEMN